MYKQFGRLANNSRVKSFFPTSQIMRSRANRSRQRVRESTNASVLSRDFVTNTMVMSGDRPARGATLTDLGGDGGVGMLICDLAGSDGGVGGLIWTSCARQAFRKRLYHGKRSRQYLPRTA